MPTNPKEYSLASYHKNKLVYEECVCGHRVSKTNKSKHLQSEYHINFLEGIKEFAPPPPPQPIILQDTKKVCCHICGLDTNDLINHQKSKKCKDFNNLVQRLLSYDDTDMPDTPIKALYKRIESRLK